MSHCDEQMWHQVMNQHSRNITSSYLHSRPIVCLKHCMFLANAYYCLLVSIIIFNADVSDLWTSLAYNDVMISSHSRWYSHTVAATFFVEYVWKKPRCEFCWALTLKPHKRLIHIGLFLWMTMRKRERCWLLSEELIDQIKLSNVSFCKSASWRERIRQRKNRKSYM